MTNIFVLGSEIQGIPKCYLWVFYEDVFVRFRFELFPAEAISIAAPNIEKQQLWFLAKPYGVVSTDLDGALSKVNAAVSNA